MEGTVIQKGEYESMVLASTEYNYMTKAGQTYQSPYLILIPVLVVLVIIIMGCFIKGFLKHRDMQKQKEELREKTKQKTKDLESKKEEASTLKKNKKKISHKVKQDLNMEIRQKRPYAPQDDLEINEIIHNENPNLSKTNKIQPKDDIMSGR